MLRKFASVGDFQCSISAVLPKGTQAMSPRLSKLSVWYSPEWDELRLAPKSDGFLFKNDIGEFHLCYRLKHPFNPTRLTEFYYIGEFE